MECCTVYTLKITFIINMLFYICHVIIQEERERRERERDCMIVGKYDYYVVLNESKTKR